MINILINDIASIFKEFIYSNIWENLSYISVIITMMITIHSVNLFRKQYLFSEHTKLIFKYSCNCLKDSLNIDDYNITVKIINKGLEDVEISSLHITNRKQLYMDNISSFTIKRASYETIKIPLRFFYENTFDNLISINQIKERHLRFTLILYDSTLKKWPLQTKININKNIKLMKRYFIAGKKIIKNDVRPYKKYKRPKNIYDLDEIISNISLWNTDLRFALALLTEDFLVKDIRLCKNIYRYYINVMNIYENLYNFIYIDINTLKKLNIYDEIYNEDEFETKYEFIESLSDYIAIYSENSFAQISNSIKNKDDIEERLSLLREKLLKIS